MNTLLLKASAIGSPFTLIRIFECISRPFSRAEMELSEFSKRREKKLCYEYSEESLNSAVTPYSLCKKLSIRNANLLPVFAILKKNKQQYCQHNSFILMAVRPTGQQQ